jgi:hypothetical protein
MAGSNGQDPDHERRFNLAEEITGRVSFGQPGVMAFCLSYQATDRRRGA